MALNKLREAHKAELKLRDEMMKLVKIDRPKRETEPIVSQPKKITFDLEKIENSVANFKKTSESLKKKPIVVLDKNPVPVIPTATTPVVPVKVAICQARNINGTPCKCKATKFGKFCAKHVP